MVKKTLILLLGLLLPMLVARPGRCLDAGVMLRLQQAGISESTIELIAAEKVIETCAFTVDALIGLKQAGLEEKTIRALVAGGSFLKNRAPLIYGQAFKPVRLTSLDDLIRLKKAGFDDRVIQALITVTICDSDAKERENAWKMLEQMGIVLDFGAARHPVRHFTN